MRLTLKSQVTVPKHVREALGIGPGSEVGFKVDGKVVTLEKREKDEAEAIQNFEDWTASVAGTFDTMGMDGKEYVDWLRGPREDLDSH